MKEHVKICTQKKRKCWTLYS